MERVFRLDHGADEVVPWGDGEGHEVEKEVPIQQETGLVSGEVGQVEPSLKGRLAVQDLPAEDDGVAMEQGSATPAHVELEGRANGTEGFVREVAVQLVVALGIELGDDQGAVSN